MDNVGEFVAIQAAEKDFAASRQRTPEMNCYFANTLDFILDATADR